MLKIVTDSPLRKKEKPYGDWKWDDNTNTVDSSLFCSATEVMKIEFNGT